MQLCSSPIEVGVVAGAAADAILLLELGTQHRLGAGDFSRAFAGRNVGTGLDVLPPLGDHLDQHFVGGHPLPQLPADGGVFRVLLGRAALLGERLVLAAGARQRIARLDLGQFDGGLALDAVDVAVDGVVGVPVTAVGALVIPLVLVEGQDVIEIVKGAE